MNEVFPTNAAMLHVPSSALYGRPRPSYIRAKGLQLDRPRASSKKKKNCYDTFEKLLNAYVRYDFNVKTYDVYSVVADVQKPLLVK